jgi:hypothetical protein
MKTPNHALQRARRASWLQSLPHVRGAALMWFAVFSNF